MCHIFSRSCARQISRLQPERRSNTMACKTDRSELTLCTSWNAGILLLINSPPFLTTFYFVLFACYNFFLNFIVTLSLFALLKMRIDGGCFTEIRTRWGDPARNNTPVSFRQHAITGIISRRVPGKHNYIITDYNDLCDNSRGLTR